MRSVIFTIFFCFKLPSAYLHRIEINKTACSPTSQVVDNKTIWWGNYSSTSMMYSSKPLCLTKNFEIVKRFCYEKWYAEPSCERLQNEVKPCPNDFLYFEDREICYTTIENQTFPPTCPYPNVMSFFDYKVLLEKGLVQAPVWFPAQILAEYGVGTMILTEPTELYGTSLSISYYWRSSYQKDCLIYTSTWSFEAAYCNSTYRAICAYYPLNKMKNNYCSMNQTKPCIMSDFDINSAKCLCVERYTNTSINRCENFAELKQPYQNFISTKGAKCRIGLENRNGSFIWLKSQEEISHSNWSINTNFYNTHGAIETDVGWSLEENETSLNCVVCEEDIHFHESSLNLRLDTATKQLVLTIINMQDLVITSKDEYPVFCFSDTSTNSQVRRFSKSYFVSFTKVNENKAAIRYQYSRNCPGHYWCEAFQYPNFELITTDRVLVLDDELYGNEFVTTILIQFSTDDNPASPNFFNSISINIHNLLEKIYDDVPFYLRWMSTVQINADKGIVEFLIHITSKSFNAIESEHKEFTKVLSNVLDGLPMFLAMTDVLNVKYCLPSTTILNGTTIHWPITKINTTIIPFELCLQGDGSPVTRTCYGDFMTGAKWTAVNGYCSQHPITSPVTEALYHLLHSNASLQTIFDNLIEITEHSTEFLSIDVHFISQILEDMDKRYATDLSQITKTINNILNTQKGILNVSQLLLNSTDRILYNFDVLLRNFYKDRHPKTIMAFKEVEGENLIVFSFNARRTSVRGIGLFNIDGKMEITFLEEGVSYTDLTQAHNLEVATYIPNKLLEQINNSLPPEEPLMVAISIFMNDYLFNENQSYSRRSNSKIFGVLLPLIDEEYVESIPVIFRPKNTDFERKCAYWNYGTSSDFGNFKGRWEEEDGEPFSHNETNLELCEFSHTTHFALLILGELTEPEQDLFSENQTLLNVITTVGCGLSIFGILIIFLTFFLFKRWRENKGNQILVQFGIVTILQICLLYTSSQVGNHINKGWCVLIGAFLHFAVLSQFCWMLVMAILQYIRFVLVFRKPSKWILLKACLFSHVVPLIIVVVYVTVFNDNYVVGQTGMCYPTGEGLLIGVLIPGGCIIVGNLIIFCVIIWKIFYRKLDNDYSQDYALTLRLRLVFVLFFMLGITWIFGFVAELTHAITFVYLFCSTASLQGFIMFLAFIMCNENTRKMYIYLIKTLKYRMHC